jgi:hypothetical protein
MQPLMGLAKMGYHMSSATHDDMGKNTRIQTITSIIITPPISYITKIARPNKPVKKFIKDVTSVIK